MSNPIRAALEARLAVMTPALPTVWDNQPKPQTGPRDPYQRCYLIPAEPRDDEMGTDIFGDRGVFQVNLIYPPLAGAGAAEARARLVRAAFKKGDPLVADGVVTTIQRVPTIGTGFNDRDSNWVVPVRIRFEAPVTA